MIIGIDPDLRKSGVAVVDCGEIKELLSLDAVNLVLFCRERWVKDGATVAMEDPNYNKPIFDRPGLNALARLKVAQNVGQVKAAATLLAEFIASHGVPVEMVPPLMGYAKAAKKDADMFKRMTQWNGSSNEDQRDAALIALYGGRYGARR
ncbi:MAG TPA: hypothetical protein DCS87_11755 [Rheinheimera sp.]|nr:hypothetical protein [Rheinheimera sp.]